MPSSAPDPQEAWLLEALERYERPLLKYAIGLCGDRELARDTVQETFLKLVGEASEDKRPENLPAWLFSVCRNRLIDIRRRQFRLVPLEDGHLEHEDNHAGCPARAIEDKEQAEQLAALIARLPERERELIRLKFQAGLPYREIAQITGLTEGHVGYLLHHAIKSLRDDWQRDNRAP